MIPDLIFLLYVPRSGSTFLAEKISTNTDEIGVLPEAKFLELLLAEGEDGLRKMSKEQVSKLLTSDPRWKNLNISDEKLSGILDSKDEGIKSMTYLICKAATGCQPNVNYFLIKNGTSLWTSNRLIDVFGEETYFLHVKRDPRGASASMINSKKAFKNRIRLLVEPIRFSKYWLNYVSRVEQLKQQYQKVIEVGYEDLCENMDGELDKIFFELGVKKASQGSASKGLNIAKREKEIHPHIKKDAIIDRTRAWQRELPFSAGVMVESITGKHLEDLFFIQKVDKLSLFFITMWAYLKSILFSFANKGINLYNFLIREKSITLFLNKLKLFLIRKK